MKSEDQMAIEQILTRFCKAITDLNVDDIMALYVPDETLHVFDMQTPRQYQGAKALRKDWEDFIAEHVKSVDVCENSELVLEISGNLAASHCIQHAELTTKPGEKGVANTRLTHIFRKVNGKWLIVHEHGSYPIDWKTGVADRLSTP